MMTDKPMPSGVMQQPQDGLYAARIKVVAGHVTSGQLRVLAEAADRLGNGAIHLTDRQGIEIHDLPGDGIEPLGELLATEGLEIGGSGKRVRTIVACPGTRCKHGLENAQALAFRVHERVRDYEGLPGKFKIAISGCPNGCAKPQATCLGIMGRQRHTRDGQVCTCYTLFVGGKMGRSPKLGEQLPVEVRSEETLLDVAASIIEWYRDEGEEKERFANMLERVGMEALMDHLTETTDIMAGG
ncbi:MAG: hypothetical protein J7M38_13130 [Armatimonadetes bacterium]|nr:hypothetical protein [Armatimonadota bacterium]